MSAVRFPSNVKWKCSTSGECFVPIEVRNKIMQIVRLKNIFMQKIEMSVSEAE